MPYMMDARHDAGSPVVWNDAARIRRVVTSDHETLAMSPFHQFVPSHRASDEDGYCWFLRMEYEVGRVHYRIGRARKSLPARIMEHVVCDRFKRTLERLEPGLHRFAPIDLRLADGETPWPEPYWYWRCEHFVDAIVPGVGDGDPKRSNSICWNADKGWFVSEEGQFLGDAERPMPLDRPVLNEAAIAGRHAWRDNGFYYKHKVRYRFLSDGFVEELRSLKAVSGLELREVGVSDLPASRERSEAVL